MLMGKDNEIDNDSDTGENKLQFVVENCTTYVQEEKGKKCSKWELGDFALKLLGELQLEPEDVLNEGYWVATCSAKVQGIKQTRNIVFPAYAFDSKAKFLNELRIRFGGGMFNFSGGVTASVLAEYYSSLKSDVPAPSCARVFKRAMKLGHQMNNYWIISKDLHIKNGSIVGPADQQYFLVDPGTNNLSPILENHLLDQEMLQNISARFLQLSDGFGLNSMPFKLSTAFVLLSHIKAILSSHGVDLSDESCIGLIYSAERNIGKSLSLRLLAKAQGLPKHHPLLCSGGDQTMTGSSVKVLQKMLSQTSMVLFVDDPVMTASLAELLLVVQGGLPQGSMKTGSDSTCGSILLNSNDMESERIHGRVLRFDFKLDPSFSGENERSLHGAKDLVEKNKGFLVAWVIIFFRRWLNKGTRKSDVINKLIDILKEQTPEQQSRWHKGAANLIYTYVVVAGLMPDVEMAINQLVSSAKLEMPSDNSKGFWERFCEEVEEKLSQSEPSVLTWINPRTRVSVEGVLVPAIAFRAREVTHGFTSLTNKETKAEIKAVLDSEQEIMPSVLFATDASASIDVLKSKEKGAVKNSRAYKIPRSVLGEYITHHIDYACGVRQDLPPEKPATEDEEEVDILESCKEDIAELKYQINNLKEFDTGESSNEEPDSEVQIDLAEIPDTEERSNVLEQLTPVSKIKFELLSPKSKSTFKEGVMAGVRLASGCTDTSTQGIAANIEDNRRTQDVEKSPYKNDTTDLEDGITPSTSTGTTHLSGARRNLFVARGTVGVLKRKYKDRNDDNGNEKCKKCNLETPPKSKLKKVKWVECGKCKNWYHIQCVGLRRCPSKQSDWMCC